MAHEIQKNDVVVTVGKPAWHSLDCNLPSGTKMRPSEALVVHGFDWKVEARPAYFQHRGEFVVAGSDRFIVREDDGTVLGRVGGQYTPFQNWDLAVLADRLGAEGGAEVETCGTLRGGRVVWFLLKVGSFDLGRKDVTNCYCWVRTTHDGSGTLLVSPIKVRVLCANTDAMGLSEVGRRAGWAFRHDQNLEENIGNALFSIQAAKDAIKYEAEAAERMMAKPMSSTDWDLANIHLARKAGLASENQSRGQYGERVIEGLEWAKTHPTTEVAGRNLWGWYQGTTLAADHFLARRGDRAANILMGRSAQLKVESRNMAVEMLAAAGK